jgi:hypothetical protein
MLCCVTASIWHVPHEQCRRRNIARYLSTSTMHTSKSWQASTQGTSHVGMCHTCCMAQRSLQHWARLHAVVSVVFAEQPCQPAVWQRKAGGRGVQLRPGGRHLGCELCCCAWTGAASTVTVLIAVGVIGALWSYDSGNTTAVNSELRCSADGWVGYSC